MLDGGETEAESPSIGRYRLLAELGRGGMANVYLAVDRAAPRACVVIKVPRDAFLDDPMLVEMFAAEARLAARLRHRNVVETIAVIEDGGFEAIVMEYLDGQTLNELLSRGRRTGCPLPLAMHLRVVCEALSGLHYAHELVDSDGTCLAVVHRDVSPHNVFVTFDGNVKLLDFGVANTARSSGEGEAGTFKGKLRYVSPEQFRGARLDRRADIYAVGVMLWEAAVGRKLWKDVSDDEVVASVVNGRIPMPRSLGIDVGAELEGIIERALAAEPAGRPASCLELRSALEAVLHGLTPYYGLRDVGEFTAALFTDTRAKRARIIERELGDAAQWSGVRSI